MPTKVFGKVSKVVCFILRRNLSDAPSAECATCNIIVEMLQHKFCVESMPKLREENLCRVYAQVKGTSMIVNKSVEVPVEFCLEKATGLKKKKKSTSSWKDLVAVAASSEDDPPPPPADAEPDAEDMDESIVPVSQPRGKKRAVRRKLAVMLKRDNYLSCI